MKLTKEDLLKALYTQWHDCNKCNLTNINNHVFGAGNPDAEIFFIGMGPGADEDHEGIPFVGKAGGKFNRILLSLETFCQDIFPLVKINRDSFYISNLVMCRTWQEEKGRISNRDPYRDEWQNCLPRLYSQINIIQPKLLILLGETVLKAIAKKSYIGKLHGRILPVFILNNRIKKEYPAMATFHPAALLYESEEEIVKEGSKGYHIYSDLKKAIQILHIYKEKEENEKKN